MISKATKEKLIDGLVERLSSGRVSAKNVGFVIRTIHFIAPFTVLSTILYGAHLVVVIQLLFMFLALVAFILMDGCIVSMIEYKLCNDDILIIDPFLELSGYEITNSNRKNGTYLIGGIYILGSILIYLNRFWF